MSDDPEKRGASPPGPSIDFRKMIEVAAEPIAVHDGKGTVLWANDSAARLVAAPDAQSLVGRNIMEFVAPEQREWVTARARQLADKGGAVEALEQEFVRLDGSRVVVETSGAALGGGLTLVVVRDVSRRLAAERGQREAEQQLRAFFELSPDAIGVARDGVYVFVNSALLTLFGYGAAGELVGRSVAQVVAPSERERIAAYIRGRAAGEPIPTNYETKGLRRDGSEFALEVRAAVHRERDATFVVAIVRDVTEQRAWESRLRESERRYRELFDFVPVSLWEVDGSAIRAELDRLRAGGTADLRAWAAGHPAEVQRLMRAFRLIGINAHGCALAGASSPEELIANQAKVHTPDTAARYSEIASQLLEGTPVARAEGWVGTLRGERRWIETAARAMPGHESGWGRLLFASIDVTDRRRVEEERATLQERLRQAEKLEAVGRLAGGIAHDFNNILSGILGYAELTLLAVERGSEVHDHQERIREAALRARALVRQILTFSRRDRSNRRTVDVPMVVEEALGLMRAGIPATVTVETRIDPEAGAALADPTQIHQIVLNLCANARDAVGPYGRIAVEVGAVSLGDEIVGLSAGPYVRLRVRDDGAGMDEETKARIFEPFMTTKGPFGGHGLGLPVVHGIVSAAGGGIQVESSPGRGATFDVYLPRSEPQRAETARSRFSAAGRGERVLIVDDEPLVLNAHRRLLESLGYEVTAAANGEEALRRFREAPHAFDLVLTDQTMPSLSGADLARALFAIRADLPVILCTGYSDQIDDQGARRIGLRALLHKPIDRETLSAAVQQALRT